MLVDIATVFFSEVLLHDVEVAFGNPEPLDHFCAVKMRIGSAGLVRVLKQGPEETLSLIDFLFH